MPDKQEKIKNELSSKEIKESLTLACIRKIPVEILYDNHRYQCVFSKIDSHEAEEETILLELLELNLLKKFSEESKAVNVNFVLETKRFMFQSKIKVDKEGNLRLTSPETMRPIEARRFFRVEPRPEEPIPIMVIREDDGNLFEARVEDISVGGLKFFCQSGEFKAGEKFYVGLFINYDGVDHRVLAEAIIKHVRRVRLTSRYHCGIQFTEVDKDIKIIINKFVSERQIEERKRIEGLLKVRPKGHRAGKDIYLKNELKTALLQIFKDRNPGKEIRIEVDSQELAEFSRKKVLIIDNDDESIDILSDLLNEKYELSFDATGLDGINKAISFLPDIIFLEIDLEGLDGYKVCQILKSKEKTQHIPIIIVSRRNTREDVVRALASGAVSYIVKPYDQEDILKRLEDILSILNTN
ncbi:MAG: response regulator [bacterium]